jgi:hypothetical protein
MLEDLGGHAKGDVIEVPDDEAERYIEAEYVEKVDE